MDSHTLAATSLTLPEKQQLDRGAYEESYAQPGSSIKRLINCGKSSQKGRAHTEIEPAVKTWVRPIKRPGESNYPRSRLSMPGTAFRQSVRSSWAILRQKLPGGLKAPHEAPLGEVQHSTAADWTC